MLLKAKAVQLLTRLWRMLQRAFGKSPKGKGPVDNSAGEFQAETETTLADRLARIEKLESEIIRKASSYLQAGGSMSHADFFVLGAVRRTLAQAKGFRELIGARNFPCAAAILRMQLDTAMRVNGLFHVENMGVAAKAVLDGAAFNTLKDVDGRKMSDAHLRHLLSEQEPWINAVYKQTSDFVHLSGRHLYSSIFDTDDETRTVRFMISGVDSPRPDSVYFEIVDTFFEATKLVGLMTVAFFGLSSGSLKLDPENQGGPKS